MGNDPEVQERLQTFIDPVNLQFCDLTYVVKNKTGKSKTTILKSLAGEFFSGKLTAILGPSGAGKSSLLNVLSGIKKNGVKGNITINGKPWSVQQFKTQCCYITYEFALLPLLTTRETLAIAADLKLGHTINTYRKNILITEILDTLGLLHVANNQVGSLSGGEKKRLSIGLELITNPPIMFFDEPTSGLDSTSALQIMTHLKQLASKGRAIVCIIHQPSSKIFDMFDDLYVMSQGHCIYKGPSKDVISFFDKVHLSCPKYYNPADFVIEVASGETGVPIDMLVHNLNSQKTIPISQYNNTCVTKHDFDMDCDSKQKNIDQLDQSILLENKLGTFFQFWILFKRSLLCTARHSHMAWIRSAAHLIVALLLGAVYYNIGNDADKFTSNMACLFFFILFLFFANSMPTVLSVPMEAAVFYREQLNNWYTVSAYFFAKLVSDIPFQIICPTLFLVCSYFLTGQPADTSRFLHIWLIGLLMVILGQMIGLVIGAACDAQLGVFLVAASSIPMLLFSGFFLRLQDIPVYFKWLSYVSYFRYAFEANMLSVFSYNRSILECSEEYCPLISPEKILSHMGMSDSRYEIDVVALTVWILLLQALFYCTLKWRLYQMK